MSVVFGEVSLHVLNVSVLHGLFVLLAAKSAHIIGAVYLMVTVQVSNQLFHLAEVLVLGTLIHGATYVRVKP